MSTLLTDLPQLFEQATALLARGEPRLALQRAQQAWSLTPDNADCCNLVGVCAMALGERSIAEQCWLHAIALRPDAVEATYNLAMHYTHCQRRDDAERCYRKTVEIAPAHAGAYAQLGLLLAAQKRDAEAEQCYRQALALAPADSTVHANLGILLARAKRVEEAEQSYRRALALDPASGETTTNLGLLLASCNRMAEAERYQRMALQLSPRSAEIHSNLANLLASLERTEEAEQCYRQALALDPDAAIIHANFGVLLAHAHRDSEAEQCFRHALSLAPGYQLARLNLALLLLEQGRLREAWSYHEARYHPDLPDPDAPLPSMPIPMWQGESLLGKSLLVWPEQGLGDMIQFCRYLPLLKEQGAARLTLVCRQALVNLMRTLQGVDCVIAIDDAAAAAAKTAHDYWTLPMSLPLHCHTDLSSIPVRIPYLHVPSEQRAIWLSRLPPAAGKFRVGVVWQGNRRHANDAKRSLPGLSALMPLWATNDIQVISLQYKPSADAMLPPNAPDFLEWGSGIDDFADTAALLEQVDLLITVDTATAHLAGALGTVCWVLLPAYRTDWRWMRTRSDSPWYPDSMRLFRQATGQDWNTVIEEVAHALHDHIALPSTENPHVSSGVSNR